MAFKENDISINRNGRPRGTPNKTTNEIKVMFQLLLENNIDKLQGDFDKLQPSERIRYFLDLASFVIPKQKAIEIKEERESKFEPITFEFNQ
jgi:hypothetical protein